MEMRRRMLFLLLTHKVDNLVHTPRVTSKIKYHIEMCYIFLQLC